MQALLLAHLLSDFAFQADWMVRAKQRGPSGVAPHITVVAGLTLLAVAPALGQWWPAALFVVLTHAVIDIGKVTLDRRFSHYRLLLFYLDQGLHVLVLVGATLLVAGHLAADPWNAPSVFWRVALDYSLVTFVLGILLRVSLPQQQFKNRWLGALERALFLTLPLLGLVALALGLLMAGVLWLAARREQRVGIWAETLVGDLIALLVGILLRAQLG